jgi:general secretion pathway protein K
MALVSVLWGITLLSIIAAAFLSSGNLSYRSARNSIEAAQLNAIVEGTVARVVLTLLSARPDRRWRTDGVAQETEFSGIPVSVSIQDELGRIDINHADAALLARVFQVAGLDSRAAGSLTDKILDWREPNSRRRLNGANEQDYRTAGSTVMPRRGPFQSLDELKLVMTMTSDIFRRAEPALTVYSGSQFFDQRVAPRESLMALPGMDSAKVDAIISARGRGTGQPMQGGIGAIPTTANNLLTLAGRAFTIRTEIKRSGLVHVDETVVRLTEDPTKPYWVLSSKAK